MNCDAWKSFWENLPATLGALAALMAPSAIVGFKGAKAANQAAISAGHAAALGQENGDKLDKVDEKTQAAVDLTVQGNDAIAVVHDAIKSESTAATIARLESERDLLAKDKAAMATELAEIRRRLADRGDGSRN